MFARNLCLRAPFGLIGEVQVFEAVGIPTVVDAFLQLRREFSLSGDGVEDRLLTFLQFLEFGIEVSDMRDLDLVETSRPFLAVTGNKRDGTAFVQQSQRGINATILEGQGLRDDMGQYIHDKLMLDETYILIKDIITDGTYFQRHNNRRNTLYTVYVKSVILSFIILRSIYVKSVFYLSVFLSRSVL